MADIFTLGIKADTRDVDRGKKSLDKFTDSAKKTGDSVGELRDTVNTAGKAVVAFGVTSAAALTALSVSAANSALEITNLARVSGLSTEEFQKATFAAKSYGIEQDKLADIFKDTQDKVGDFLAEGGGELVQFFDEIAPKMGVTADQFRNLSGKDALQLYVSTLEGANVSQTEMITHLERIASDATLLQPLLANNGKEFERMGSRAEGLGLVLDGLDITNLQDMGFAINELGALSEATGNIIGATLAPFVTDLTTRFNDNAASGEGLRSTITDLLGAGVAVTGVFADAGRVFEIFGTAIGAAAFQAATNFNKIDENLEQQKNSFSLFFAETTLGIIEWANEMDETLETWASSAVNALDVFDLFDDVEITFNSSIDTTDLETSIETLKLKGVDLADSLIESNAMIEDAWQSVRDLMAEPLPSEGFKSWFDNIEKIIDQQKKLQKGITDTGEASNKTTKIRASETAKWLSGAKEVSKGVSAAFGENERAQKAAFKLNQVIALAEQALILSKIQWSTAETAVVVSNAGAKAAANSTEAITAAYAAPFPVGFAAGAAMIGIMASLGLGGGGGGDDFDASVGQESQGTGTVFGSDDKSNSITQAQERFEDIQIEQLSELRGIRNSISDLSGGIEQLSRSVVGGVGIGDFAGSTGGSSSILGSLFGNTSKKLVDEGILFVGQTLGDIIQGGIVDAQSFFTIQTKKKKLFGLSSSTSTSTETQDISNIIREQMADIFTSIGDTVLQSAELLGFETTEIIRSSLSGSLTDGDFSELGEELRIRFSQTFQTVEVGLEEALAEFQVDIGQISLEGLNGEEIQAELEAVFSQQADLIAEFLVPSIAEYQKIGEGLFDTLARVTQEQVIFNDAIAVMGFSLSDLSNVIQIDIAQGILDLIGGAERFSDLTGEFFNEFFTEAEQFDILSTSLTEAVEGLGLSMFESREAFREMLEGIDITTEAGQALFAALLELVPAMDELFDILENEELSEAAEAAAEAERLLSEARRSAEEEAREQARAETEAARLLAAETKAAESEARKFASAMKELTRSLTTASRSALAGLSNSIRKEQDKLSDSLGATLNGIAEDFSKRRGEIELKSASQVRNMENQLGLVNGRISDLTGLAGALANSVSNLSPGGRTAARSSIQEAISGARSGRDLSSLDLANSINILGNINEKQFDSALELQLEQARTASELSELKDLTGGQLSQAERNAQLLNQQIETVQNAASDQIEALNILQEEEEAAAQARHDDEVAQFDLIYENAQAELNELLGINTGVESMIVAQETFASSLDALAAQIAADTATAQASAEAAIATQADATAEAIASTAADDSLQAEILTALVVNSSATKLILEKWDGDGLPAERTG